MRKTARIKIDKLTDKWLNRWDVSYVRGVNRCPVLMRRSKNGRSTGIEVEHCLSCKYCLAKEPRTGPAHVDYIYCIGHIPEAFDEYKLVNRYHRLSKKLGDWSSY